MDLPASSRSLARAAMAVLVVGAGVVAASVAFVRRTAAGHLYAEADVPVTPVGLVLGAQVLPGGEPSPFLAVRLDLAHRLYATGRVRVLLVSGDSTAPEHDEPAAMRDHLVAAGVPAERVVTDPAGYDTYDSCARARRIFGVTRLTVVTQSYHLARAVATARALGLDAVGVGDDSLPHGSAWRRGVRREWAACVKTVIDLVSRRDPALGARDHRVEDALE